MAVLIESVWPGAAAAFVVGLAFAALFGPGRRSASASVLVRAVLLLALAAAIAVAIGRLVPGRAGLWLDLGLLLAVPYAAGSILGGLVRSLVVRRRRSDDAPSLASE